MRAGRVHLGPVADVQHLGGIQALALDQIARGTERTDLFYITAYLREVGPLEEPAILDPALGGIDTATRLQTVWRVDAIRGVDPTKPEEIQIGARVRVEFEQASDDMHLPFWRVVED